MLLEPNISPVLHRASDPLNLAASCASQQAVFVTDGLNRLLDGGGGMSAERNTACRDAVSRLTLIYQADYLEDQCAETQRHSSGRSGLGRLFCQVYGSVTEALTRSAHSTVPLRCTSAPAPKCVVCG